jgi:hypothetical protein
MENRITGSNGGGGEGSEYLEPLRRAAEEIEDAFHKSMVQLWDRLVAKYNVPKNSLGLAVGTAAINSAANFMMAAIEAPIEDVERVRAELVQVIKNAAERHRDRGQP